MGQRYTELSQDLIQFIWSQSIFFVATAPAAGRVNLSPKGMDSLRVINPNTVSWLNVTGSGNETAAHLLENDRMTIMLCAFEGKPMVLRLYGRARVYHARDVEWGDLAKRFEMIPGARQIFVLDIELVLTSCGMGVPYFEYKGERRQLTDWAEKKGAEGISEYWEKRNQLSLDGKPTGIFEDS